MKCRTCKAGINLDPWGGKEEWKCLFCDSFVCVWCYHKHTSSKHTERYVVQEKNETDKT